MVVTLAAHCGPGDGAPDGQEPADAPGGASASGGAGGASPGSAGRGGNPFDGGVGGGAAGGGAGAPGGGGASGGGGAGGAGGGQTGLDADGDGIDDGLEDTLAKRFAPVLRLAKGESFLPASVEWYLPRVHMRFHHDNCFDHEIVALGEATMVGLGEQSHQKNTGTLCAGHAGAAVSSGAKNLEFFLQPPDDDVHNGALPADWRAYAHVKKSQAVPGGYDVQYWFFYPFNSTVANFDHEADWEHLTVVADAAGALDRARYAAHSGGTTHPASALEFVAGTSRPVGYVSRGSHATYHAPGTYKTEAPEFVFEDVADGLGPTFDTLDRLVNVGELGAPLHGQAWVNYGGRWGEIGQFANTSGPPSPSFQASWAGL